jgi:hypothetical protein
MSVYPSQQRAVDPYDSYHSNIVNRLTRMISRGENCLHSGHAIDVIADGTSTTSILVTEGECFKDDVLLTITAPHTVDFTDLTNYVSAGGGFNEAGYYYILLEYTYQKSRPAPRAAVKILKPSQRANITATAYLFLKCVEVDFNGVSFEIVALHDNDPSLAFAPYSQRHFSQLFFGIEFTLPTFNQSNDENRVIYVLDEDEVYYGTSTHWEPLAAVRAAINTTGITAEGYLGYVDASGIVQDAIATSPSTFADCVVVSKGSSGGEGMARLYGPADNVPVESGRTVTAGEKVYLSETEAGKISDLIGTMYTQCVGVCVGAGTISGAKIWFQPASTGESHAYDLEDVYDIYTDLLQESIYMRLTLDILANITYVDTLNTTTTLNTGEKRMDGDPTEEFWSLNLVEPGYDSTGLIQSCQLSSDYSGNIDWYLTNYGDNDEWEGPVVLDEIHDFANVRLPIAGVVGTFEFGEVVTEAISGYTGVVSGIYPTFLLLSNCVITLPFTPGRGITGNDSGATATVNGAQINRTTAGDYIDVRVKAIFNTAGYIEDYGVLYDEDEEIIDTLPENELNIETLYSDIYTSPVIDNDGMPQLSVPLQTRITGYLHTEAVATNPWVIVHGLNVTNAANIAYVVCTNLAGTQLTPTSVVYDSANQITVTFAGNRSGYARVIG